MDDKTTISELKKHIKKICDDRDWDQFHSPKDLAIGIATESSELLEQFRFKSDKEIMGMLKDLEKRKRIGEELADSFYFILRFCQKYNFDLSDIFKNKMEEVTKKYPIEKAKGSNKKYNEF